jgi:hypothetical protein
MSGHPGVKQTLEKLWRNGNQWKGIRKDVKEYVKGCQICQRVKPPSGKQLNPLYPLPIPDSPWDQVSWDLIRPLPKSCGYNAIVTIANLSTKGLKLELATVSISMGRAAQIMCNYLYREEGLPSKVYSDRGPQFVGAVIKDLYRMLGIEGNLSMAYHLQTDGQTEWMNREVEQYLRMYVNYQQNNLAEWLPLAEFTYNNGIHEAMGHMPFFLNHGRHP